MKTIPFSAVIFALCIYVTDYALFKYKEYTTCRQADSDYFYYKAGMHFCPSVDKVTIVITED